MKFPSLASGSFSACFVRPTLLSVVVFLSLPSILFSSRVTFAQQASSGGRAGLVTRAVDESDRVILHGSVNPLTTHALDLGAVPASMPAERLMLLLQRSPEQELALRAMIESLHDANSPNFHKWLTPEQFGAQWGATDSDIALVTAWLQSHGFQVEKPLAGRTAIVFSGTMGQVQETFHTSIHTFSLKGETHHANISDPQIPASFAQLVAGIATLNDFHPRALVKKGPRGIYDATTGKITPEYTQSGSFGNFLYVGPSDVATIYNSPNKALNPAYSGATVDGTGAVIGIIGDSNITPTQALNYQRLFGLAQKAPTVIIDGGTDPGVNGDAVEAYLDTQVAGGVAPGATVLLYTAADTMVNSGLDLAIFRAINDNRADVLNLSFGACEGALGSAANKAYELGWEQAATQGISVTVSTGDSGSAGCDDPNTETEAVYGLQVNGLASTPFNIAVGGTDFGGLAGPDGTGADFTNYVSTTNAKGTLRSAKGYIPEVPWNDSAANFPLGVLASNIVYLDQNGNSNIVGAGGGKSNCSVGDVNGAGALVCKSGYTKPSWQAGMGVPKDGARDVPDVSLFASNGFDYAAWGICTDQDTDSQGNPVTDCSYGSNGLPANQFYIYGVGGTSASAPAFAGILALIKQSTGDRQGQADYVLYDLASKSPSSFHDITTGNNSVTCQSGTPNCVKNAAGAYFLTGYDAGAGYDLATGLGTVDIAALVKNWRAAGLATSTTSLSLTPSTLEHGQSAIGNITVNASKGTATGLVSLTANAHPPGFPLTELLGTYSLNSAGSTGNIRLNSLPGGDYSVIASYGGSPAVGSSISAPIAVRVMPEPSTTPVEVQVIDPASGNQVSGTEKYYGYFFDLTTQPYGNNSAVVGGKVVPDGIATGTVTFEDGGTLLTKQVLSLDGSAYSMGNLFTTGTHTILATYSGDTSFQPSQGRSVLVINKAPTKLTMTSSSKVATGKPITFTVTMTTNSAGVAPTGAVELLNRTTVIGSGKLVGVGAGKSTLASGSAVIMTSDFSTANDSVVARYVGDNNYATSSSAAISIKGRPGFAISVAKIGVSSEHSSAAGVVNTRSIGGYAGTVKYACTLIAGPKTSFPAECGMDPGSATLTAGGTAAPLILIFGRGTTLPPGVQFGMNHVPGNKGTWLGAAGGVLACFCMILGIPARRKSWRAMLSLVMLLGMMFGLNACAYKGQFITHGLYTFTVTGTDASDPTLTTSTTVVVDVL